MSSGGRTTGLDSLNYTPILSPIECPGELGIEIAKTESDCDRSHTRETSTICVGRTDVDTAIERLISLFREGHDICVLVSCKSGKTLVDRSIESTIKSVNNNNNSTSSNNNNNVSNNNCSGVSLDALSILPSTDNMYTSSGHSGKSSGDFLNPSPGRNQHLQSDIIASKPFTATMCYPSSFNGELVSVVDDSTTVIGMAACFCESLLVEEPHDSVFISFTERSANSWMDLVYRMPGPTSMPLHLRRYAVRELTLFSQTSFHTVNSMRDVMELSVKAIQNRPKRSFSNTTSYLVIQVLVVPSDDIVQWNEDLYKTEDPKRIAVFTQPILCKPFFEALGILTPPQESLSSETFEVDLNNSATSDQTQRILCAVGGVLPATITVHLVPGLLNAVSSSSLQKKVTVREKNNHETTSLKKMSNLQVMPRNGNRPIAAIEYHKHSQREGMCDRLMSLPVLRKIESGNTSEVNARSDLSCKTTSTLHLARRALDCLQKRDKCNNSLRKSLSCMNETSYSVSRLDPSLDKVNLSEVCRAVSEYDCRMFGPYLSEQSHLQGSEITAGSRFRRRKLSDVAGTMTVPHELQCFYEKKKLYWERESVLSGELEERSIIEREEKQHRRITEAMIENMESHPHQSPCTPHISSLVAKGRFKSPFYMLCRFL
ncbi:uncharacterized protein TM35_000541160 [Trypanosoma theileri]|uniref:Uncharacterized protein n=1 Tax=Trypanosoma theileri TaxID=67003 RepID=A0A1X0NGM6_9TRYP|nr:uncharacterized protein TM35_000541160 [Trypanosoma theileri]ORC83892.1 hypothetical protein TM35_000541160 [Trypanosoma theileri]